MKTPLACRWFGHKVVNDPHCRVTHTLYSQNGITQVANLFAYCERCGRDFNFGTVDLRVRDFGTHGPNEVN